MPRKTAGRWIVPSTVPGFNEAAARCRGKHDELVGLLSGSPPVLQ